MKKLKYILAIGLFSVAILSCEKDEVVPVDNNEEANPTTKNAVNANTGLGGSLAQFTVVDNYLYTIDYKTLNIFNLNDPTNPTITEEIDMGVGMETVFHQDGYLYIGANDGVHIYDISDPRSPMEVSDFEHVTSCDPVVANGEIALATLRGGTECGGNLSQLDVLDLTNIYDPQLIYEMPLDNPYGLGFNAADQNIVYICDGTSGLKIYNISDVFNPQLVTTIETIEALDVISTENDQVIVLARDGVYQYEAKNPVQLVQKSVINI